MVTIFQRIIIYSIKGSTFNFPNILRYCKTENSKIDVNTKNVKQNATVETSAKEKYNKENLKKIVNTKKVVVFMKGNPKAPRCGFSNAVVEIFRMHGVQYEAHDVLANIELRQNIKDFTDWPTIPQVFINGEFIGGCDILLQMHQNGDLINELRKVGIESLQLKTANTSSTNTTNSTNSTNSTDAEKK